MGCADGAGCRLRGLAEDRQAPLRGTSFLLEATNADKDNPRSGLSFFLLLLSTAGLTPQDVRTRGQPPLKTAKGRPPKGVFWS